MDNPFRTDPVEFPAGALRILQITDPHLFANPEGTLLRVNTLVTFNQVLDYARAVAWPADLVLATGDLVHDASPEGYQGMRERFAKLGIPTYCIPGNHDDPRQMAKQLDSGLVRVESLARHGGWSIILLDSSVREHEGGHLAPGELERLDRSLSESTDTHALVCLHHNPVPTGSAWLDTMTLDNRDQFLAIIDRHPQVRGVLWGHIHQVFEAERNGVAYMASPSTCIQFMPGQKDFALDNEPPGFRWLGLLPDGTIETGVRRLESLPEGLDLDYRGGY